jgi:two-component system phosphate regulon response regulator PhoB
MEGAINHAHSNAVSSDSVCSSVAERRVLIVDHDAESVAALRFPLSQAGFKVSTSSRGEDPRLAVDRDHPHVVMVDWDLPAVIAMDLLRHVRRHSMSGGPRLIALSSFAGEQHVVSGFELGVDDYVIKPYSVVEVVARVRAVLRPMSFTRDEICCLEFRELQLDASESRVTIRGEALSLRHLEFRLLQFLMRRPERAHTREALLLNVWGGDRRVSARAVDVTIQRIRRVLTAHDCEYLQTVRGVGYRLSVGSL